MHTLPLFPTINWIDLSKQFIESMGLKFQALSTQIEPHDTLSALFDVMKHTHHILLDLAQDCWQYISLDYLKLATVENEVGSSTMPHKVNPIHFENAEGNLGIANSLLSHFSDKLTRSRMQRDLSDSTVLRNIGGAFAYSLLSYQNLIKGLQQVTANQTRLHTALESHWEVLAEPIQTVMRKYRIPNAYEQLKAFTRGKQIDREQLHAFIATLTIPASEKEQLLALTPHTYIGLATACVELAFEDFEDLGGFHK